MEAAGITFLIGSTVFYTSLLLGASILYVFDGPRSTRIAIATIAGVSALTPIVASVLHVQMGFTAQGLVVSIPVPSLRINTASVLTTIVDLIFLTIAWDFLGKTKLQANAWLRTYLTLLGVMMLDVILFNTGAFLGTSNYLDIMQGTMTTRILLSVVAYSFLYFYMSWQNRQEGVSIESRPVLSIFRELEETRDELETAREEIRRRKEAEEREKFLYSLLRHDVRNRTQVVQGYHELLRDTDLSEKQAKLLERAANGTREGIEIIEKVRTLREISGEEETEEVDIGFIIKSVVDERDIQASEEGINIKFEEFECEVEGGPLLEELFSNLLENSIVHSVCETIQISSEETEDKCVITVEDDGCGMDQGEMDKVFDKGYKKGETGGTGLGLYLVKEIAENYGGSVEVRDSKLGGARFDTHLKRT